MQYIKHTFFIVFSINYKQFKPQKLFFFYFTRFIYHNLNN